MGRIPRWPGLAVARGMNRQGELFIINLKFLRALLASLLVEDSEGSRSTSKLRLLLYTPQLHSVFLDTFRSPRRVDKTGQLYHRT